MVIGKKELAERLGWTRARLDRFLKSHPDAPVRKIGDQSGGWEFVWEEWVAYLKLKPETKTASGAIDPAQLADAVKPPEATPPSKPARRSANHDGEATAKQRNDLATAQLKELKLAEAAGQLIDADGMRHQSATIVASLAGWLDALPERIVTRLGLPPGSDNVIQEEIDEFRRGWVKQASSLTADA